MAILPLPPSGVAFIDPITGGVSVQWQNYLLSLSTIGGGFAPIDAEYWVSTPNSDLTNETNLGALASGYLKLTTAAGVGTPSTVTSIPGGDVTGAALTKTDDTNITLTLTGTPLTALLRAVNIAVAWAGTLAHGRGGTDVTSPGSSGNVLTSNGTNWTSAAPPSSVTSVAATVPGGFSISGSPITSSGTLAIAANGTSGGVPYYSGATTMASSGALTAHGVVIGGGAATSPTSTASGSSGQVLTSNGASADPTFQNAVGPSFASTASSTASPTGTSSATSVMMGLAGTITPTSSGRITVTMSGYVANNTIGDGGVLQMAYGTGSAPINGAAATGTTLGSVVAFTVAAAGQALPFSRTFSVTGLSVSTAYWLDLQLRAIIGGTASVNQVDIAADEH